jgi:hypothetical protein
MFWCVPLLHGNASPCKVWYPWKHTHTHTHTHTQRPAVNISLDEAWGRTNKEGVLISRPDRILLVRHGESAGNHDEAMYTRHQILKSPLYRELVVKFRQGVYIVSILGH